MKHYHTLSIAIISMLLSFISTSLTAQTKKGNWLVEGNLGNINFSNNKSEYNSGTYISKSENQGFYFSLYPRIGYFVNDNLVLGTTLNLSYQFSTYKSYWNNGLKSYEGSFYGSSIGLSPFMRYYFTKNTKDRLYAQVGAGMNIDLFRHDEATTFYETGGISGTQKSSSKGQFVYAEVLIGFNHFFINNVAFNSSLGYSYNKRTQNSNSNSTNGTSTYEPQKNNSSTLSGNLIWNFGFTCIIAGKKVESH